MLKLIIKNNPFRLCFYLMLAIHKFTLTYTHPPTQDPTFQSELKCFSLTLTGFSMQRWHCRSFTYLRYICKKFSIVTTKSPFYTFSGRMQQHYVPDHCRTATYSSDLGFGGGPIYKVEVVGWYVMKPVSLIPPHHLYLIKGASAKPQIQRAHSCSTTGGDIWLLCFNLFHYCFFR